MTLPQYYDIILSKIQSGDYKLRVKKGAKKPQLNEKEYPLYALAYLIFEWQLDHKDPRWQNLFDYVLIPNVVNKDPIDIDFTKMKFEEFFDFMVSIKQ